MSCKTTLCFSLFSFLAVAFHGSAKTVITKKNPYSQSRPFPLCFPKKRYADSLSLRGGANAAVFSNVFFPPNNGTYLSHSVPRAAPKEMSTLQHIFSLFTSTESFFGRLIAPFATDPDIGALIAKICSYAFWMYVSMCVLGTVGIDTKPFLTFLNVALITLGFAAKDLITNSFAGIFILFTRPFARGALVRIGNFRGHVVSIDIRYVKLMDPKDGSEIMIPLSMVYGSPIVVESSLTTL
jgi:small-conductance mechanosensitive channel